MAFFYLSQVLGRPVCTDGGERVARIKDLVARIESIDTKDVTSEPYPPISGLVVDLHKRVIFIPWAQVASLDPSRAQLASSRIDLRTFERREGEVLLRRDILDKQLVDIDGRRVILANDLLLYAADGMVRVAAVDVSGEALVRRLTFGKLFAGTEGAPPTSSRRWLPTTRLICWPIWTRIRRGIFSGVWIGTMPRMWKSSSTTRRTAQAGS